MFLRNFTRWVVFGMLGVLCGCAGTRQGELPQWRRYTLKAEQIWQLNLPEGKRFDASGLLLTPMGDLLTESDRGADIYRIEFVPGTKAANLVLITNCFTEAQLQPFAKEKVGRYDCEGLAQDEQGRLYLCEESNRWILRCDPRTGKVERLDIDWSPVRKYFSADRNASFEGIAIHGNTLYVANERDEGRIIVVDLTTLKVTDHYRVGPRSNRARNMNYSDLSWFDGALYVLLRESRCVLKVDPATHRVLTEYDYRAMEDAPEVAYHKFYPTGTMEGLAVDKDYIWLTTDNNGYGRVKYPKDIRPTLFRCRRPDGGK